MDKQLTAILNKCYRRTFWRTQEPPHRYCVEFRNGDTRYWALVPAGVVPTSWNEAQAIAGSVCLDGYKPANWEVVATFDAPERCVRIDSAQRGTCYVPIDPEGGIPRTPGDLRRVALGLGQPAPRGEVVATFRA